MYADSWMLNYGQALLIKHLIIIPILIFTFTNDFLVKKRMQNDLSFDPKPRAWF